MRRKEFIKNSLLLTAGSIYAGLPATASPMSQPREITILYTNDTHSRINPFPSNAIEHAGMGGISQRSTLVKKIRQKSPNTLLLDAGDVFQGTPWFHLFGGRKDLELMSMMGYDAMCLGNHEFDNGLDGFAEVADAADFPILCANYRVKDTPMAPFVQQFTVCEKVGIRIGIFGLGIRLNGLVRPELYGNVRYANPIIWADRLADHLRTQRRCDYIICLSHLGYRYEDERIDDLKLASSVNGIDLIIGGHTHTFLDAPDIVRSPDGGETVVTQAGHSGIRLGRIDVELDDNGTISGMDAWHYRVEGE